jgi:hypothetical protein
LLECGIDAAMVYLPSFRRYVVPDKFSNYSIRVAKASEIPPGATVVLPEVFSAYLPRFKRQRVFFWWMSVDFYFTSADWVYSLRSGMLPWHYQHIQRGPFPANVKKHLVQSEYARLFLESHAVSNIDHLGDYLNNDYLALSAASDTEREDIVVYNPSKGIEYTRTIIDALPRVRFIPIKSMTRDEVISLLRRAKVYIDFGNHPGKDRIPREAAILGCCVITNRRGSAGNRADVPIPDKYKLDDQAPNFAESVAAVITKVLDNFDVVTRDFDDYRNSILLEPALFVEDTRRIFSDL